MFTGDRSGDWLYRALWRAGYASAPRSDSVDDGLVLNGVWVTAAVHCAPPANKPTTGERDTCGRWLRQELRLLPAARVVVALGHFALQALANATTWRPRPAFSHLAEHRMPAGGVLLCSYHPSQQNTFTGKLTEPMLDAVFTRARELCDAPERPGFTTGQGWAGARA